MWKGNLLSCGTNAKTMKGDGSEYLTAIMYLTPFKTDGFNLCPSAELAACIVGCLNTAGKGAFNPVQAGRARKTQWFITDRAGFLAQLVKDIASFSAYCAKRDIKPCVRLNGTSDVRWELFQVEHAGKTFKNIMAAFPDVQYYDYSKLANRRNIPDNYHLTFSYSEANPAYAKQVAIAKERGMNIAVVFRSAEVIPDRFLDLPTIDGDKDDLRFLDMRQAVVALYAKGQAKKDTSGFVIG